MPTDDSSAIIGDVLQYCESNPSYAIAYFYFDFNDTMKQQPEHLLHSLITQFSSQCTSIPNSLETLYTRCQYGKSQPITSALIVTLHGILQCFQHIYIIIDALDECVERRELLDVITKMVECKLDSLHILTLSRKEQDIKDCLEPQVSGQIDIQSVLVDVDIQIHICDRLQNDPKLKKWPANVKKEIETTLMNGAHGM
jgi:hypothetical protein